MINQLNPRLKYFGSVKVGPSNTRDRVGKENRIFYLTSGKATLVIEDRAYPVSKNSLAYVPSYTKYRFELVGEDEVTIACMNFDITARGDSEECAAPIDFEDWDGDRSDAEELLPEFSLPIVISGAEAVQKDVNRIAELFFAKGPYYADYASAYMKRIVLFAISRAEASAPLGGVSRILEYVRENYRARITNYEIARHFGYHPNHLNRVVKQYTGMPLREYIISCRVAAARELLASTDEPITVISENLGFSTPSYFAEIFSRSEGMTPREYRSKVRNVII